MLLVPIDPSHFRNQWPQAARQRSLSAADVQSALAIGGNNVNNYSMVVKIVVPWLVQTTAP